MRTLSDTLLRELAACEAPLCLSLYMEVAAGGGDHNQIRIALKNAKAAANEAIQGAEPDDPAVVAVRERLEALDYEDVAGGSDRRIAVFIGPDLTEIVDVRAADTGIHAGSRFRLAPLLPELDMTPEHAVLVAGRDYAELWRVAGGTARREPVEDMPASLRDVTKFTDRQEKGDIEGREDSGGPGATAAPGVPHHSMGGHDWREDQENELRLYANLLINAAQRHLAGTNLPLVVAADERLYGMIRENSEYPWLAEDGITANPMDLGEEALIREAADCLERQTEKLHAEAWDKVAISLGRGDGEASEDPERIAMGAAAGQIQHLFVRSGVSLPGRFDNETLVAELADDGPEDLVDRAIADTLRNSGKVFPMRSEGRGSTAPMAAAFRYAA